MLGSARPDETAPALARTAVSRRRLLQVAGGLAVLGAGTQLLAACGDDENTGGSSSASSKQLRWIVPEAIDRLDVGYAVGTVGGTFLLGVEPLILLAPDGTLGPNLAASFEQPDALTYVFKLRQGVKFWDGASLTADDVAYSLNIHAGEGSESKLARVYANVASIEATADDEVTITMAAGDPQLPYGVAISGIVQRAFHEEHGDEVGTPEVLNMGTGPFRFESFETEKTVLVRNDDYWGDKPVIERLELFNLSEESARLLAVRSGDADGSFAVPTSQAEQYGRLTNVKLVSAPDPAVVFFALNQTKAPWNDLNVRRALAYAIDREGIVRTVLSGRGRKAITLTSPEYLTTLLPESRVQELVASLDRYEYDINKARAELAKSSVPNGFDATIIYSTTEPDNGRIAEIVSQSLAEIGIRLTVEESTDNDYSVRVWREHTEAISIVNFGPDGPEPSNIPLFTLHSRNRLPASYTNIAEYENGEVDRRFDEEEGLTADDPQRGELLAEILEIAAEELPYIPIYQADNLAVHREGIAYAEHSALWFLQRWTDQLSL